MFLGLSLLVVGVVLCLNGVWQFGRIEDREICLINFAAAAVFFAIVLMIALAAQQPADLLDAGMTLLFGTTYLWVGYNRLVPSSGAGLGWFSGFVALTAAPMVLRVLAQADGLFDIWLAACWAAWSGLWFLFFLNLALNRGSSWVTAYATLLCGIFTGWLPGLAVLPGLAG
ncbi:AmiS/UreI family transporter [Leisingera sp. ANG-Vp]|uniref:AmiS/UreI family transporter n=1 Tax=Leisingera sp. ANG-Vp TaxID=1577896 RepID=UPI00057F02BC|nr:AmiS/UreI family transporter [Leisingera sp. ANG-Vp]KIC13463.1 transporter [Leisingera sp. ANG-Vp]